MIYSLIDPITKLKEISSFSDSDINEWIWKNNEELGGTIPVYLFGTEREIKIIEVFKRFAEKNNKLKPLVKL